MSVLNTFFAKETHSYSQGQTRIAKCYHCKQITKQTNDAVLLQKSTEFVCMNCSTYSHRGPCPCGNCESHPYNKTGLTEKDISIYSEETGKWV